jgi:hypothetical protein
MCESDHYKENRHRDPSVDERVDVDFPKRVLKSRIFEQINSVVLKYWNLHRDLLIFIIKVSQNPVRKPPSHHGSKINFFVNRKASTAASRRYLITPLLARNRIDNLEEVIVEVNEEKNVPHNTPNKNPNTIDCVTMARTYSTNTQITIVLIFNPKFSYYKIVP